MSAYLPSPLDRPPVVGHHPKKGTEVIRKPDPSEPFCGLVFKITNDAHGDLSFVRIYSGVLKSGSRPYNPGSRQEGDLFEALPHPGRRAGQDRGIVRGRHRRRRRPEGLGHRRHLCDAAHPVLLEKIEFPETVISMSIEPVSSADKGKLADTLASLAKEDPTFAYKVNEETGQTLISGMGELHMEILKNRMVRDYKLKVHVGRPRVSYRETIKKNVKGDRRKLHPPDRRLKGCSPRIKIDLEHEVQPKGGPTLVFVNKLKGGVIPAEFIGPIEAGFREEAKSGGITDRIPDGRPEGHPDRRRHPRHRLQRGCLPFRRLRRLRKAVAEAASVLLEPIMKLEVVTPEDYLGDVMADLLSRRAQIDKMYERGKLGAGADIGAVQRLILRHLASGRP